MLYLASPYTHENPIIMEHRYKYMLQVCAYFANNKICVYSPIVHWHPVAKLHSLPKEFEFWQEFDRQFLDSCDEMLIIPLQGWEDSKGINAEVDYCEEQDIPFRLMDTIELHRVLNA